MKDFIVSVSGNRARQQTKIGLGLEGKPQLKSSLSKEERDDRASSSLSSGGHSSAGENGYVFHKTI